MNQYEVAVLYHPDLEVDLSKAEAKVTRVFKDNDGKVVSTDNWGKRRLSYPIKKQEQAIYVFYTVEMPAEGVRKVESSFNITDEVIRYLIVRPDLKAIERAEKQKAARDKRVANQKDTDDNNSEDEEDDNE